MPPTAIRNRGLYQYRNALHQSRRMTWAARIDGSNPGLTLDQAPKEARKVAVAEADLGPIRYLATLIGAGNQDVLRWFILIIAVLLDPTAVLLLLAAASARR